MFIAGGRAAFVLRLAAMFLFLILGGCRSVVVPPDYVYKEIPTRDFTLASWQKITDPASGYKIYIEGDGLCF